KMLQWRQNVVIDLLDSCAPIVMPDEGRICSRHALQRGLLQCGAHIGKVLIECRSRETSRLNQSGDGYGLAGIRINQRNQSLQKRLVRSDEARIRFGLRDL